MQTLPYGSWPTPITADYVHGSSVVRGAPRADGERIFWREARPLDEGRNTLVRQDPDGGLQDVSLPGQDVRTALHEYGGGEFAVGGGYVVYVEREGQQVWVSRDGDAPRPVTAPTDAAVRYAGFCLDVERGLAYCTREDQRDQTAEPVTSLVRIDLHGDGTGVGEVLQAGLVRPVGAADAAVQPSSPPDFVLDPAVSPDGRRLAWLTWHHPRMAWEGTYLWVADLDAAGDISAARIVAGAESAEAIEQPTWLDDDRVLMLSDRSGWSLFHVLDLRDETAGLQAIHADERDYGIPRWVPGMRAFAVLEDGLVVAGRADQGFRPMVTVHIDSGEVRDLDLPLTYLVDVAPAGRAAVATVATADQGVRGVRVALDAPSITPLVRDDDDVLGAYAVAPEAVSWIGYGGERAYGFLYRPHHPEVAGAADELPPLVVTTHGGPTADAVPMASRLRSYFTSRGLAVLDVNYAGSTGFGRAYRERLNGLWGIADVQDAALGARHLADTGVVDGARMAIRGGSAGGYLTLSALTQTDVFAAGTSLFGIADVGVLAEGTHKLESRYTWGLIGPWPEARALYADRSPINHLDSLSAPLLLLQGTDDKIVPPDQAHVMAEALRLKGIPHALVMFDGEGHGFRKPANNIRATELELSFYGEVFGFVPDGDLEQVSTLPE